MTNIKVKQNLLRISEDLAEGLQKKLIQSWGGINLRNICGTAATGDYTFRIDEIAEHYIGEYFEKLDFPLAYYSEDKGLVKNKESAEFVFIIDPVDGTRAAICGLESCCVSIAAAPLVNEASIADVICSTLIEIKSGNMLSGIKGEKPLYYLPDKTIVQFSPSAKKNLAGILWAFEIAGRPAAVITEKLSGIIDQSSLDGGCFVLNSSSYGLTRVCLGQFDLYMDVWGAVLKNTPALFEETKKLFHGKAGYLHSYDVAASIPLAEDCGCIVSDAAGNSIANWKLIGQKDEHHISCVCSANEKIHEKVIEYLNSKL